MAGNILKRVMYGVSPGHRGEGERKGGKERREGQEGVFFMAINQNYGNVATYALVFYVY